VLTLAAVALTAGPASAAIRDSTGAVYNGPIEGTDNGNPTFTSGGVVISCDSATFASEGNIDGELGRAVLDFSWSGCSAVSSTGGSTTCSINDIQDVSVIFDETIVSPPDWTIINTERGATTITCIGVFVCDVASDPQSGTEVEADADAETNTVTINDVVEVSGALCPDDEGLWEAVYALTPQGLHSG